MRERLGKTPIKIHWRIIYFICKYMYRTDPGEVKLPAQLFGAASHGLGHRGFVT